MKNVIIVKGFPAAETRITANQKDHLEIFITFLQFVQIKSLYFAKIKTETLFFTLKESHDLRLDLTTSLKEKSGQSSTNHYLNLKRICSHGFESGSGHICPKYFTPDIFRK